MQLLVRIIPNKSAKIYDVFLFIRVCIGVVGHLEICSFPV